MLKDRVFVVDGNWYLHRVYYTINPKYRDPKDALVYSFLSIVCKDALAVKANRILVAFDGPQVFRYELYPEYKANRSSSNSTAKVREGFKEVYEYLPFLLHTLTELGFVWIQPRTFEADDVLCSCASKYKSEVDRVWCGTRDKDAYQYVGENVFLYDSSHKENGKPSPVTVDEEYVKKVKGVSPRQMRYLQTLTGDSVDNIPNVLTPSKAKKLLASYDTIKKAMDSEEWEFLKADREKMKLNMKLVTLRTDVEVPELSSLILPKKELDNEYKKFLPKSYFDYISLVHPRTKGLFRR